jgi:hypothetical protein
MAIGEKAWPFYKSFNTLLRKGKKERRSYSCFLAWRPTIDSAFSFKKIIENERFGLVFAKTGFINSGTEAMRTFCKDISAIVTKAGGTPQSTYFIQ